jgi:hypothetical protein
MTHGGVEGREDWGRLLDASGSAGGGRGSVRFQFAAGSMAARHYSGKESLHLDLLAADLDGVKLSCPRGLRTTMPSVRCVMPCCGAKAMGNVG